MDVSGQSQVLQQVGQSGKFRKLHLLTVMQPLTPGKRLSRYYDIQNLRQY